jgi:S-DNA-T family DNA segregation ATPase FtsK/SpoIIIE
VQIVREMRRASISLLQRRLRIGYTRAARLVDQLEQQEIIGPAQSGSQPREVLDYGVLSETDLEG